MECSRPNCCPTRRRAPFLPPPEDGWSWPTTWAWARRCKPKLQVKLAVRRWVHIPENAYVNRRGTGVGNRIEVQQQRMSVQVYLEMAGILGDLPLFHIRLP